MKLLDAAVLVENLGKEVFEPRTISIITLIEVLRGIKQEKRGKAKVLLRESF